MITLIKWFFGIVGFLAALPFIFVGGVMLYQVATEPNYRTMLTDIFKGAQACSRIGDKSLVQECVSRVKQESTARYYK